MQQKVDNTATTSTIKETFVKEIKGITFIDAIALERSITKEVPVKHHLRQKMIHAGVQFWDTEQKIVKKPVIGISAIGGISVCLEGDLPAETIKLRFGNQIFGPISIDAIADGLRETMGMQSSHTYMNPHAKTAKELYDQTVSHGHFSLAHAATLGITCLGLSKKAELEFDVQRDVVHLARETSARSICQDEPTLVAMTQSGATVSTAILESTIRLLAQLEKSEHNLNWREERNALFPLSACVSLGINGSIKNLTKLVSSMPDQGKELEFRNALAMLNDSLFAFFPELFKATNTYGHTYPDSWTKTTATSSTTQSENGFFSGLNPKPIPKQTILLLGAPGIGKSTQTERIVKQLPGVMCVSTGNLVRQLEAKRAAGINALSPTERWAAESLDKMKRGELMDDDAVYALLMAHLSVGGDGYDQYKKAHTLILDGVVKAERNIKPFEQALATFNKNSYNQPIILSKVINISAKSEDLIARQQSRVQKALAEGLTPRPDDDVSIYSQRLEKYLATMQQVTSYFQKTCAFVDVDSSQGIEQTTQNILDAMQNNTHSPTLH